MHIQLQVGHTLRRQHLNHVNRSRQVPDIQLHPIAMVARNFLQELTRQGEQSHSDDFVSLNNILSDSTEDTKPSSGKTPAKKTVRRTSDSVNYASNHNEEILRLYKEGKSNVAIAKELGLGVGEVKLVIDLAKM